MGFWEEENGESQMLLNDEAIDILMNAFKDIAELYEEGVDRKPSIAELESAIKQSLLFESGKYLSDIEGLEIIDCKLKTKKAARKKGYRPGVVVAVPILDGSRFAYGLIVHGRDKPYEILYIQYFDLFTEQIMTISEFKKVKPNPLITISGGEYGIVTGRWTMIGTVPFDESSYELPDFYGIDSRDGSYYISKGSAIDSSARIYVTEEAAKAVKNPDGVFGYLAVETYLNKIFAAKN